MGVKFAEKTFKYPVTLERPLCKSLSAMPGIDVIAKRPNARLPCQRQVVKIPKL